MLSAFFASLTGKLVAAGMTSLIVTGGALAATDNLPFTTKTPSGSYSDVVEDADDPSEPKAEATDAPKVVTDSGEPEPEVVTAPEKTSDDDEADEPKPEPSSTPEPKAEPTPKSEDGCGDTSPVSYTAATTGCEPHDDYECVSTGCDHPEDGGYECYGCDHPEDGGYECYGCDHPEPDDDYECFSCPPHEEPEETEQPDDCEHALGYTSMCPGSTDAPEAYDMEGEEF